MSLSIANKLESFFLLVVVVILKNMQGTQVNEWRKTIHRINSVILCILPKTKSVIPHKAVPKILKHILLCLYMFV